jgi:hypothetical protein
MGGKLVGHFDAWRGLLGDAARRITTVYDVRNS